MLFSVIIPAYKAEKLIHIPLSSLATQILKDFEVVIVDDNSPEENFMQMKEVCDDFTKRCALNIRIIRREVNGGCGPSLQTGLNEAKGDYFIPIDADDMFATAETFLNFSRLITQNGMPDCISTSFAQYDPITGHMTVISENSNSFVHGKCFRVQFCRENNVTFPQQKWFEDGAFNFIAFNITQRVVRSPIVTYLWQAVKTSITRSRDYNVEVQPFYIAAYTRAYPVIAAKDQKQADLFMLGMVHHGYHYWNAFEARKADKEQVGEMVRLLKEAFDSVDIINKINADRTLFNAFAKNDTMVKQSIEGQEGGFIPKLSFNSWLKLYFGKEVVWLKESEINV